MVEESLRHLGIPSTLNEDVEHAAVLIHDTPKIVLHIVTWPRPPQSIGKALANLWHQRRTVS